MSMKSLSAVAGAILLVAIAHAQDPQSQLDRWLAAVAAHEAGNPGKLAIEVATWSGAELDEAVALAKRHARSMPEDRRAEANDLLLRGAQMHADIARLIPDEMQRRSVRQQRILIVSDGRHQGSRFVSIHWDLGRSLLDAVAPHPASHPGVLAWYQETSTSLLRLRSLAEATVHLPRGRQIFPTDPRLLFLSGLLHERFSSPALQAAAASIVAANRGETGLNSARSELTRAERFFRDTLGFEPLHAEARLRHGHVLNELGRHEQAVEALRAVLDGGVTGELRYFAELLLGRAEEALGHTAAARDRYEAALAVYPRAQSPRLALSQLARRSGDRGAAQRQLQVLAEPPLDERRREDPWWHYYDLQ